MSGMGCSLPYFPISMRNSARRHEVISCLCYWAALAAFVPASVAGEMCSIGTLFAFTLVCAGVLIVRKTMPDAPRSFKTPLVPFVPIAGIITCLVMMLFLPADTWIRLVLWMLIGLDIYVCYGIKHSKLNICRNITDRPHWI